MNDLSNNNYHGIGINSDYLNMLKNPLSEDILQQNLQKHSALQSGRQVDELPVVTPRSYLYAYLSNEILPTVQRKLTEFKRSPDFHAQINQTFGSGCNIDVADSLINNLAQGQLLPNIEILPQFQLNADGAFGNNTIYLSENLLSTERAIDVVLEEIGHYIDSYINHQDAAGDEGRIFAKVVQNQSFAPGELGALKQENDHGFLSIDGLNIAVEHADTPGIFTVDNTGKIKLDFLADSGSYHNEMGLFSLKGMENLTLGSVDFIQEAARRSLSNSNLGYSVIIDVNEGAKFTGELGESNKNDGDYSGVKIFDFNPNSKIAMMLVPEGTITEVFNNPNVEGSQRPLFSLNDANPNSAVQIGQLVTGTFGWEDLRLDQKTDADYNDIIFQIKGATGTLTDIGGLFAPGKDWRNVPLAQEIINFASILKVGELDQSIDLGNLIDTLTLNGFVGETSSVAIYRFSVLSDSVFTLNLNGLNANADVELIQDTNNNNIIDDNEFLNFSLQQGNQSETLSSPLALGTYYIKVYQVEGNTNYNLTLSATIVEGIPVESEVLKEENSAGELSVSGVSETRFNSLGSPVVFNVSGASFSSNPENILVFNNGIKVADKFIQLSADAATISISSVLAEGVNDVQLYAVDDQGIGLFGEANIWAGNYTLNVTVVDENSQPISGAVVRAKLTEDQSILAELTTSSSGKITFQDLPNRTILLEALATDNRFASLGAIGAAGNIVLTLKGFNEPSPINNNDFSLGTDGWNIGTAPVKLIPHKETVNAVQSLSLVSASLPTFNITPSREITSKFDLSSIEVQQKELTSTVTTLAQTSQMSNENIDLVLNTSGEGEQLISRTFEIKPNTQSVTLRYQFITSEVPGGYFGSKFNDYFRVSIRSLQGGGNASESNSMNGLGLSAFDAKGATAFREVTLPTSKEGDTIQVEVSVANVADGLLGSQVVVDLVKESNLAITKLSLKDIDNSQLQFLSVSGNNPYFGGNTRVNGTITIEGDKDDSLNLLELQIVQGGQVVATANLDNAAQGTLLNQNFGEDKKIEVNTSQLLFNLPNTQASLINVTQNGSVNLRVRATSANGGEVIKEFGSAEILRRYIGTNRYGGRDENVGGDDWAKPSVINVIDHFSNLTFGDFSNMNGGSFLPDHTSHKAGNNVDGWFNGYNARDAATAQTMINLLNDPTFGSRIQTVGVTFQQVNTDTFWTAIQNVTLNDGRLARNVIRPWAGHTTHFHWVISP